MAGKEFVQLAEVSVILRDLGISDVDGQSDHRAGNPRLFCHKLIKSSTHRDQLLLLATETFSKISGNSPHLVQLFQAVQIKGDKIYTVFFCALLKCRFGAAQALVSDLWMDEWLGQTILMHHE